MQSSHVRRNTPSIPVTPKADTQFCVRRKGTVSGRGRSMPLPKRQSKSTWTTRPLSISRRMFSPWRSPRPTTYPSMHHSACDLLNIMRLDSHIDGSALCENHFCNIGGCLGKTNFVKVSWRSLLRSKMSLISRRLCCGPCWVRFQRSSMTWRMPRVLDTHSMRPQLSWRMTTLNVTKCKFRRCASGCCSSNWLTMTPNIIMRESLRRSPRRSALQRKGYFTPSVPMKTSFFGLSFVRNTSTWSSQRSA
mmetsp:Transcript_94654/g.262977  ORF Transcript_94654/g.262977 Transcript_94654/m.262977 type:complete len:248 (+) Transcript_94654:424-1167(+)